MAEAQRGKRPPLSPASLVAKLAEEVRRKLEKALVGSGPERSRLLQQLFKDVVLELDARAQVRLLGQAEAGLRVCYYEVLAKHYVEGPKDAEGVVPLFSGMWSNFFTFQLFALLLHRWLFDVAAEHAEETVRFAKGFVNGANNCFWIDVQGDQQLFLPLFQHIADTVLLDTAVMSRLPAQVQRDLFHLATRFFFAYQEPSRLGPFLHHLPASVALAIGGTPVDAFAVELANQLQKMRVEPVLLRYLKSTQALKGEALRTTARIRLQAALYSMTAPGGPLYPPRSVRHAAFGALDAVFPVGRRFRHIISYSFRLLHPYYWPGSFLHFLYTKVRAFVRLLQDAWQDFWDIFRPRRQRTRP